MATKKKRWTASDVQLALDKVFPSPANVLLRELRNGTGYSRITRTADAVAVSVWPSRGLYLSGIEIKVSRPDFQKELANPEKADAIQKYCKYWYVAVPKGLVNEGEVPETWGLIECDRTARVTKAAPELKPLDVDMLLVCSILRCVSKQYVPQSDVVKEANKRVAKAEEAFSFARQHELEKLRESIASFEEQSGVSLKSPWQSGQIGEAVKTLMNLDATQMLGQAKNMAKQHERIAERLTELATALEKGGI